MKTVDQVIEKVVEKLVTRENPVTVELVKEKLVKEVEHKVVKESNPVFVTKYEIAQEIR